MLRTARIGSQPGADLAGGAFPRGREESLPFDGKIRRAALQAQFPGKSTEAGSAGGAVYGSPSQAHHKPLIQLLMLHFWR